MVGSRTGSVIVMNEKSGIAKVSQSSQLRLRRPTAKWPPRDWRALIALPASIVGAAVLTGCSIWLVTLLVSFGRTDASVRMEVVHALATSNYGLLAIIGAVLLSLGLAINRRSVKGSAFGASFEAAGGEEHDDADDRK